MKKWNFEESIRNAFFQEFNFSSFFKNTRWILKKWKSKKVKSQSLYCLFISIFSVTGISYIPYFRIRHITKLFQSSDVPNLGPYFSHVGESGGVVGQKCTCFAFYCCSYRCGCEPIVCTLMSTQRTLMSVAANTLRCWWHYHHHHHQQRWQEGYYQKMTHSRWAMRTYIIMHVIRVASGG